MSIDVEQILGDASNTGTMDYSKWPEVLKYVLPTLNHIVHNDFPTPRIPIVPPPPVPASVHNGGTAGETTPTRSPKIIPATPQNPSTGPILGLTPDQPSTSPSVVPNSQPPISSSTVGGDTAPVSSGGISVETPAGALPPPILALYNGIVTMLNGPFHHLPPYTLQRLSELILHPRTHYQTLPAYLRALDKILSVASTADVYPLPIPPDSAAPEGGSYLSQTNGASVGGLRNRDDAFNGAELTRIPWIRDSAEMEGEADAAGERDDGLGSDDGPDHMLLSEADEHHSQVPRPLPAIPGAVDAAAPEGATTTIMVNGMGRGGIGAGVPADTIAMQGVAAEREAAISEGQGRGDDELATARGPQEIGNEDIGPQRGDNRGMPGIVDLEAAVGRPGEGEVVPGSNVQVPEARRAASEEEKEVPAGEDTEMAVDEAEPEKKEE